MYEKTVFMIISLQLEYRINIRLEMVDALYSEYDKYDYCLVLLQEDFRDIISDLYKDPANIHIEICKICNIAYKKLKGEDVELLSQEARDTAF